MENNDTIIPSERIDRAILFLRGQKVMLDIYLARLYGVSTKRLNEQVKRNRGRFPQDFMFQLTAAEKAEVVAICDHLQTLKFSATLPYAFTEHGAVMLSSILNSERAVQASLFVVRAFVRLRAVLSSQGEMAEKIAELEKQCGSRHGAVLDLLQKWLASSKPKGEPIGFRLRKAKK